MEQERDETNKERTKEQKYLINEEAKERQIKLKGMIKKGLHGTRRKK